MTAPHPGVSCFHAFFPKVLFGLAVDLKISTP